LRAEEAPPDPAAMIESMRAFGYSPAAAIADLVDNSVTAGASRVEIQFQWTGRDSWIAVLDDGAGMNLDRLRQAMRLGSRSPREVRAPDDLGRFGLGLKTAGFSLGRSLSVASRIAGEGSNLRRWDLDHVSDLRQWSLLVDPLDASSPALGDLARIEHGTVVVIEKLDRLAGDAAIEDEAAHDHFLLRVAEVRGHLGMVFHRFLGRGFSINVNGEPVEAWDPFLERHPATQMLPEESMHFDGGIVRVRGFVVPHKSMLTSEEFDRARGPKGWNAQQGFYVYRAKRLLVAGDWLGLGRYRQEEHYKLARIRVDLDNAMDLGWQIDVRKATAVVPAEIVGPMRRLADATRRKAVDAYRFRGKSITRRSERDRSLVWGRRQLRDGIVRFTINRNHPLVADALVKAGSSRGAVERLLDLVQENLPTADIVLAASENPDVAHIRAPFEGRSDEVNQMLRDWHARFVAEGVDPRTALDTLARMEPFDHHPALLEALAEELALT
jgi:hypothetical protein